MDTPLTNDSMKVPEEDRRGPRKRILISLLVVAMGVGAYFVLFQSPTPRPAQKNSQLPFGAEEQAYAAKLQIRNLAMSQAENFLNQEVKILAGDVVNGGNRAVAAIDATIEYKDDLNQVIVRDTRPLLAPSAAALQPGKSVHFEVSFDHVPKSWNYQMPTVKVAGLQFTR